MTRETGEWRGGGRENGDTPSGGGDSDLVKRLQHLEHRVPPDELDELWIFPPLEETEGTREFLLFTRQAGRETRRVYSARVEGTGEKNGAGEAMARNASGSGDAPSAGSGSNTSPSTPSVNGNGLDGDDGSGGPDGSRLQSIVEHGRVPAERLPRIVERFLRRLGEERVPVHVELDGSPDRWGKLLADVAPGETGGEN